MSNSDRDSLLEQVFSASEEIQRAWKSYMLEVLNEEGLTPGQFTVMAQLDRSGSATSSQLGKLLHVTPGAVTQFIDSLLDEGYVSREKDPDDKRVTHLSLTPDGQRRYNRLQERRKEIFRRVYGNLSDEELRALTGIQTTMLRHLNQL